jgi:hypothetical protein
VHRRTLPNDITEMGLRFTTAPTESDLLCCFLSVGKSRDKVVTLPKLAIPAGYELPRFLDCLSLVRTFDALYA